MKGNCVPNRISSSRPLHRVKTLAELLTMTQRADNINLKKYSMRYGVMLTKAVLTPADNRAHSFGI